MARDPPILCPHPTATAPAKVYIGHVQLRDLVICPRERGLVNYVSAKTIVEHDLNRPNTTPRVLAGTTFVPNTLASLPIEGTDHNILAAGGQDAQIHISIQQPGRSPLRQFEQCLPGSINNSVLLTSLSLTRSYQSSAEPRIGISNNDCTFRLYDVPIRSRESLGSSKSKLIKEVGSVRLDVPVNHSSVSPDGRTLLSAGDSNKVYLHHLSGSSRISFTPISTLQLPTCSYPMSYSDHTSLTASFSTAFSGNGTKFAVASQEGIVVVWDVRSTKPLKVFSTDRERKGASNYTSAQEAHGWLSDDPWDWTRGTSKAPGWSVRSLRFGCDRYGGRELMTFTEHTSYVHVVDARTFETQEVVRMPSIPHPPPQPASQSDSQVIDPGPTQRPLSRNRYRPFHLWPTTSITRVPRSNPPQRFVLALEDTFRLSPQQHHSLARDSDMLEEEDEGAFDESQAGRDDDILLIPPLGDRAVEADVRALLGRHGIRSRQQRSHPPTPQQQQERQQQQQESAESGALPTSMDVDELESDYCASHTPSRSSSPSPSTNLPYQGSQSPPMGPLIRYSRSPSHTTITQSPHRRASHREREREQQQQQQQQQQRHDENAAAAAVMAIADVEVDLAGVCFDPTARWLYVASTDGVAEWSVNGAEKRWWGDDDESWA